MGICGIQGFEDKKKDKKKNYETKEKERQGRGIELSDSERVVTKLRIQQDRIDLRIKNLQREEEEKGRLILDLLKDKKNDQAKFQLKNQRYLKDH